VRTPFATPWATVVWLPNQTYRVLATFPDRAAAVALAAEEPGRLVLFRLVWRAARHDDF
jgi:hypothetical protein